MTLPEAIAIVEQWHKLAADRHMIDHKKGFWLLLDVLRNDVGYSRARWAVTNTRRFLLTLDMEKEEVREVKNVFEREVRDAG